MMKVLFSILILSVFVVPFVELKAADSNVKINLTVQEKKPTDTINDFDLSSLNPDQYFNSKNSSGTVLGATTKADNSSLKIIILELFGTALSVLSYFVIKRKRRYHNCITNSY